jgi:hypothetical protein
MKFNGIKFSFGKANISINNIDTDKAQGEIKIEYPLDDYLLSIQLYSRSTWSNLKVWMLDVHVSENNKQEELTDEDMDDDIEVTTDENSDD